MKKVVSVISIVLLVFYSFLPLGLLATSFVGYSFLLQSYTVSAIGISSISIIAILLQLIDKEREVTRMGRVAILLLLPVSLINWLYYILLSEWKFTVLCMLICSICAFVYLIKYIKQKKIKFIIIIICVIIFIPLCFLSFIDYIFYDFGHNTIVKTIDSLDGNYKAEVIDSDQGIFGGDTFVDVYEVQTELNLYIFRISKRPQRVYAGDWGEYSDMTIYWIDTHTLFINGITYPID